MIPFPLVSVDCDFLDGLAVNAAADCLFIHIAAGSCGSESPVNLAHPVLALPSQTGSG